MPLELKPTPAPVRVVRVGGVWKRCTRRRRWTRRRQSGRRRAGRRVSACAGHAACIGGAVVARVQTRRRRAVHATIRREPLQRVGVKRAQVAYRGALLFIERVTQKAVRSLVWSPPSCCGTSGDTAIRVECESTRIVDDTQVASVRMSVVHSPRVVDPLVHRHTALRRARWDPGPAGLRCGKRIHLHRRDRTRTQRDGVVCDVERDGRHDNNHRFIPCNTRYQRIFRRDG